MRTRAIVIVAAVSLGLSLAAPAGATRSTGASIHSVTSVLSDVKAFGDAKFFGSTNSVTFNQPIVGIAGTNSTRGYVEVASDGGVFTFGDAKFFGSLGGPRLDQSIAIAITGIAARPAGDGYWMADADGRGFPFGRAPELGNATSSDLSMPVVAIASTPSGRGLWLAGRGASATAPEQVTEPGCANLPERASGVLAPGLCHRTSARRSASSGRADVWPSARVAAVRRETVARQSGVPRRHG